MSNQKSSECELFVDDVNRYAWGELSPQEASRVEQHLVHCHDCKELVEFMKDFYRTTRVRKGEWGDAGEPCPSIDLLASVEAGLADEEQSQHVRAHVVHCRKCAENFLLVRGLRQPELDALEKEQIFAKTAATFSMDVILKVAKQAVVVLGKLYSPGTSIGSLRILATGPALAVRGASAATGPATVFEVPVGDNVYGVALSVQDDSVLFDIAGYKTTDLFSAAVAIWSEGGNKLVESKTDTYGNVRLTLVRKELPGPLIVTLILREVWEAFSVDVPNTEGAST